MRAITTGHLFKGLSSASTFSAPAAGVGAVGARVWRLATSASSSCLSFPQGTTAAATHRHHQRRCMSESSMQEQMFHLEKLKRQAPCEQEKPVGTASSPSSSALANVSAASEFGDEGPEEVERQWIREMESKYGEGTYQLFRPLYKDLCDEMRREYFTKPPPPPKVEEGRAAGPPSSSSPVTATATAQSAPPRTFAGEGPAASTPSWSAVYQPANNVVVFRRAAVQSTRTARVVAYSRVEVSDPPKLNALLTFADWCPIEVLMERQGVILHFSVACNEGGMHLRNVRAYRSPTATVESNTTANNSEQKETAGEANTRRPPPVRHDTPSTIFDGTDDAEWCRQNLCYDGPCLWHLELDMLNELYDIMQDHGVTLDWIRWAAEWVSYLEHVNYARWAGGVLEKLIPNSQRGPEEDFLTEDERAALDEPAEDWLSARSI